MKRKRGSMTKRTDLSPRDAQVAEIIETARKDKFLTVTKLCGFLDISRSTYYRKLYNSGDFTVDQIRIIKRVLELSSKEMSAFY